MSKFQVLSLMTRWVTMSCLRVSHAGLFCILLMHGVVFAFPSVDEDELKNSMVRLEVGEMNSEMEQLLAGVAQIHLSKLQPNSLSGKSTEDFIHPILYESDFRGYNIVKYKGVYYAVDRDEGQLDITEIKSNAKLPWFSDATLQGLKAIVTEKGKSQKSLFEKIAARIKK